MGKNWRGPDPGSCDLKPPGKWAPTHSRHHKTRTNKRVERDDVKGDLTPRLLAPSTIVVDVGQHSKDPGLSGPTFPCYLVGNRQRDHISAHPIFHRPHKRDVTACAAHISKHQSQAVSYRLMISICGSTPNADHLDGYEFCNFVS